MATRPRRKSAKSTPEGGAAVRKQRKLQARITRLDAAGAGKPRTDGAMQAGARNYPVPPLPGQHQSKPGNESGLTLAPCYDAPYYRGSDKLKDKVALITGGDSGIGRAVAVLFAREGADIVINYLDAEQADAETTAEAVRNEGRECELVPGDITREEVCTRLIKRTIKRFGHLDILVNNAAFQLHAGRLEDLHPAHFDETLHTNLYGMYQLTRAALPHMKSGSTIINTGSVTGIHGSKQLLDYSMTKGAIHAWTRSLAGQLIERGIRVNAVAPGPVWTPLNPSDRKASEVSEFGEHVPMGRPAQPEEISPAFVFLASPQTASYITGETLPVTGGVQ